MDPSSIVYPSVQSCHLVDLVLGLRRPQQTRSVSGHKIQPHMFSVCFTLCILCMSRNYSHGYCLSTTTTRCTAHACYRNKVGLRLLFLGFHVRLRLRPRLRPRLRLSLYTLHHPKVKDNQFDEQDCDYLLCIGYREINHGSLMTYGSSQVQQKRSTLPSPSFVPASGV